MFLDLIFKTLLYIRELWGEFHNSFLEILTQTSIRESVEFGLLYYINSVSSQQVTVCSLSLKQR